jgi:hypothetical protein
MIWRGKGWCGKEKAKQRAERLKVDENGREVCGHSPQLLWGHVTLLKEEAVDRHTDTQQITDLAKETQTPFDSLL